VPLSERELSDDAIARAVKGRLRDGTEEGGLGSKGAIFFHCASVSNGPDRVIGPPSALLTLLIPHFTKLNHNHFRGLYQVVQQLLSCSS